MTGLSGTVVRQVHEMAARGESRLRITQAVGIGKARLEAALATDLGGLTCDRCRVELREPAVLCGFCIGAEAA